MTITIHQPNFIPWYPFFEKIQQADIFVLLGHCQFEKNGFQNRFSINDSWNTMSVKKGTENINDKLYLNAKYDWKKLKKRLWKHKDILDEMDYCISNNLYDTNKKIIQHLIKKLNINTKLVEDFPTNLVSSERLLIICKEYGATTYLAGQGGREYLDESIFINEGIKVIYQENLTKVHTLEYLKNEVTKF